MTKRVNELISLSGLHEATSIVYWKSVKLAYFGITASHYGFLCHYDHFYELKFILPGRTDIKLLNRSLYFSSIHEGRFFYKLGGMLPTKAANYC